MKERENFATSIISATNFRIEISVTDNLDNSIFNYPLTVDILVPTTWQSAEVSQGNNSSTLSTFTSGGNTYVRTQVIPDGGNVVITNGSNVYTLSGTVKYYNSSLTPVKNVTIKLKDSNNSTQTTVTDSSGNYSFTNLTSGNYTFTVTKMDGWGGVNAADALLASKYYTNTTTLDQMQLAAGDVNNDGVINAADALLMMKRYANLISSFSIPDWIFSPSTTTVTITNQNVVKNITGIVAGNVTKSFIPY